MDTIKNIFNSNSYKWVLWIVAELFLLTVVFALGMRVGTHKAKYFYQNGRNYGQNFMRIQGRPMMQQGFRNNN